MVTSTPSSGSESPAAAGHPSPPAGHSIAQFYHAYEEEGRLLGYHCRNCGFRTTTFLLECPRCHHRSELQEEVLSGKGRVASFSLQNVPSEEFLNDAPYAYVLVELDEGGMVSGWMPTVKASSDIAIGDRVHWVKSYKIGMVFEKGEG